MDLPLAPSDMTQLPVYAGILIVRSGYHRQKKKGGGQDQNVDAVIDDQMCHIVIMCVLPEHCHLARAMF